MNGTNNGHKKRRCKRCEEVVICTPDNPRPKCKCKKDKHAHSDDDEKSECDQLVVMCPQPPPVKPCQNCGNCNNIVIGRGPPDKHNPVQQKSMMIYIDELTGLWYILYGCNWAVLPMPCLV
jgi:hypothetical protein